MGFDLWNFLMGAGGNQATSAIADVTGNTGATKLDASLKSQQQLAASGDLAGLTPPPQAPDFSDTLVRRAGAAAKLRAQAGFGRQSTFLTGAGGAPTSGLSLSKPTLLGGG